MDLLATLLLAHLVADFPLQTDWVFRMKVRHWSGILLHVAIHSAVTAFLIQNPLAHWPLLLAIFLMHALIDWLKLYIKTNYLSLGFLVDQLAHFLSLVWVASWASNVSSVLPPRYLYPLLAYAVVPLVFMYIAILMVDLNRSGSDHLTWLSHKYLQPRLLSQLSGYPLVIAVVVFRFWG